MSQPVTGLAPDFVLAFVILDVAIILIAARLLGKLALRVGQPRVVGEILAGILLGPTLLGATVYQWGNPWSFLHCDISILAAPEGTLPSITTCFFPAQSRGVLGILGQIALIFFMFLVGLEFDWDLIKGRGRGIITVAVGVVVIPIGAAFVIGPLLYDSKWIGTGNPSEIAFTLMIASMLAVTAFPVMARILQEKHLTQSVMGSVGIAAAALVTVFMFVLLAVATGVASHQTTGDQLERIVGVTIYFVIMLGVARPLLARTMGKQVEARGAASIDMFAVALIFVFASAYAADRLGINVIVGGFLAGAVLPARQIMFRDMSARMSDLSAAILLPIFLAFSGLNTDFTKLGTSFVAGIVLVLVAAIASKWGGGIVSARLGGLSWKEGNVLGVLMNCRGLLVLVVALAALNAGVISPQLQTVGVLVALVTTMMTGPLFDRFYPGVSSQATTAEEPRASAAEEVRVSD